MPQVHEVADLVLGDSPSDWDSFSSQFARGRGGQARDALACQDGKPEPAPDRGHLSEAVRAEMLSEKWSNEVRPKTPVRFSCPDMSMVELPLACVAARKGETLVLDVVLAKSGPVEQLRAMNQEIGDGSDWGLMAILQSPALDISEQDLGFALVSAAAEGAVPCLAHLLRKAEEIDVLTALCSDSSKYGSTVWHLSIFEHALMTAVQNCDHGTFSCLLTTLEEPPLLHSAVTVRACGEWASPVGIRAGSCIPPWLTPGTLGLRPKFCMRPKSNGPIKIHRPFPTLHSPEGSSLHFRIQQ